MQKFGPYNFVKFNNSKTNGGQNSDQNGIADFLNALQQNSNNNEAENQTKPNIQNAQNENKNEEDFVTPKTSVHYVSEQKKLLTAIKPNEKIAHKPKFNLWE